MTSVRIVDYGIGNLHSVVRAFSSWSGDVRVVSDGPGMHDASHLVLPGVGAFGVAMNEIRRRGLEDHLREFAASGKPVLGLCVGMQILASEGHEDGLHTGLDLVPGKVVGIDSHGTASRVPNMGWRDVQFGPSAAELLAPGVHTSTFYFAHSFEFKPLQQDDIAGSTEIGGRSVVAVVRNANVWGLQFHPEKSAAAGLDLLKRFLALK